MVFYCVIVNPRVLYVVFSFDLWDIIVVLFNLSCIYRSLILCMMVWIGFNSLFIRGCLRVFVRIMINLCVMYNFLSLVVCVLIIHSIAWVLMWVLVCISVIFLWMMMVFMVVVLLGVEVFLTVNVGSFFVWFVFLVDVFHPFLCIFFWGGLTSHPCIFFLFKSFVLFLFIHSTFIFSYIWSELLCC